MALRLSDLLALEEVEPDVFTGPNEANRHGRLFGGQVMAQALRAAAHTVAADRLPHSAHAYFLRPGDPDVPVRLVVHRDRDGGSFSARRVVVTQGDDEIFTMLSSFHHREPSGVFDVPLPDDVPDPSTGYSAPFIRSVEVAMIGPPPDPDDWRPPSRIWARAIGPLPDEPIEHACALAYVSDIGVGFGQLEIENLARGGPTIDHALWFQHPLDLNDWVLLDLHPWKAGGARGVYTGTIHDRQGRLGATLAQEVLLRVRR